MRPNRTAPNEALPAPAIILAMSLIPVREDASTRCPLCHDGRTKSRTICGHSFCTKCIHRVLCKESICPICRHQLFLPRLYHDLGPAIGLFFLLLAMLVSLVIISYEYYAVIEVLRRHACQC